MKSLFFFIFSSLFIFSSCLDDSSVCHEFEGTSGLSNSNGMVLADYHAERSDWEVCGNFVELEGYVSNYRFNSEIDVNNGVSSTYVVLPIEICKVGVLIEGNAQLYVSDVVLVGTVQKEREEGNRIRIDFDTSVFGARGGAIRYKLFYSLE